MKKLFYLLAVSAFVFTASCSDDDDNGGNNGSDAIRQIKVKASEITGLPSNHEITDVQAHFYGASSTVLKTVKWDNGFELELPETVSSSYLQSAKDYFEDDADEANGSITVTGDAKIGALSLVAYSADDTYLSVFEYGKILSANKSVEVQYLYSTADCTVKGTLIWEWDEDEDDEGSEKYTYNLTLKKGWNRIAVTYSEVGNSWEEEYTTNLPSGLTWFYGSVDPES